MTKTILLVEDNKTDEKLTLRAFQKGGIESDVVVTRDGAEALEWLFRTDRHASRDPSVIPSLVLLDLKLPKVSGLDVLRQLRADERTRLLPVVVLTSSLEDEDVVRSYALGANAYVRKPVDHAAFVEAAKTLGVFWLVMNENPPARSAPT